MIKYKKIMVEQEVPVLKVCDRCGREEKDFCDLIEIRHEYGYGSQRDTEYVEADICEKCFDEIIKSMHINVRRYTNAIDSEFDGMV